MSFLLSVSWLSPTGKNERLAAFTYTPVPEKPDILHLGEARVNLPDTPTLILKSNYEPARGDISLAAFQGDVQLFLWHCKWDESPPYFGFRLSGGGFMHLHFQRVEKNDPKEG